MPTPNEPDAEHPSDPESIQLAPLDPTLAKDRESLYHGPEGRIDIHTKKPVPYTREEFEKKGPEPKSDVPPDSGYALEPLKSSDSLTRRQAERGWGSETPAAAMDAIVLPDSGETPVGGPKAIPAAAKEVREPKPSAEARGHRPKSRPRTPDRTTPEGVARRLEETGLTPRISPEDIAAFNASGVVPVAGEPSAAKEEPVQKDPVMPKREDFDNEGQWRAAVREFNKAGAIGPKRPLIAFDLPTGQKTGEDPAPPVQPKPRPTNKLPDEAIRGATVIGGLAEGPELTIGDLEGLASEGETRHHRDRAGPPKSKHLDSAQPRQVGRDWAGQIDAGSNKAKKSGDPLALFEELAVAAVDARRGDTKAELKHLAAAARDWAKDNIKKYPVKVEERAELWKALTMQFAKAYKDRRKVQAKKAFEDDIYQVLDDDSQGSNVTNAPKEDSQASRAAAVEAAKEEIKWATTVAKTWVEFTVGKGKLVLDDKQTEGLKAAVFKGYIEREQQRQGGHDGV